MQQQNNIKRRERFKLMKGDPIFYKECKEISNHRWINNLDKNRQRPVGVGLLQRKITKDNEFWPKLKAKLKTAQFIEEGGNI